MMVAGQFYGHTMAAQKDSISVYSGYSGGLFQFLVKF